MSPDTITLSKGIPANFEVVIPRLPSMTLLKESDDLILHIHETLVPSMAIDIVPVHWQGIKVSEHAGTNITFEDWNLSFTVDAELKNWRILQQWINYITSAVADQREHLLPEEYQVNAALVIYDNFRNALCKIIFIGAWIQTLGEISLSNRDTGILESTATIKYGHYEVVGMNETI
jgi:hypothetical protein